MTLGPGPPPPSAATIPPRLLATAQAGLADAIATLALAPDDLTIHAVGPRRTTPDAVEAAAFMAAAVRAGRNEGFVPRQRSSAWRYSWYIADHRPWPGPNLPAVLIRDPSREDDTSHWSVIAIFHRRFREVHTLVGPSGQRWRVVGVTSRRGPMPWRYSGAMLWTLAPDDPTARLADGDILRPAGPFHYVISGEHIRDIPSLCRALEHAVDGEKDSWGWTLGCIHDRLYGGFGMDHPCTLTWQRSDISRRVFDARALANWAARCIAAGDYLDEEGHAWLIQAQADGNAGKRTLFDEIVETIESVSQHTSGKRSIDLVLA